MKILLVGDIVASPGRKAFATVAERYKAAGDADFIVVNAENAAGGKGLTGSVAEELFSAGADVITLGDHTWDQREFVTYIDQDNPVLRPANFAPGCPGRGCLTIGTGWGSISVINLVGRVFMKPYDCPFRTADALLAQIPDSRIRIVDIHAEATSEKIVLGRYLDGRVTCVVGTHTHVQTSDECILPDGTAYITDLGMTGPKDSAIGRELESVTHMFLTGMPAKFKMASRQVALEGAVVDVDIDTGRARSIRRIREHMS